MPRFCPLLPLLLLLPAYLWAADAGYVLKMEPPIEGKPVVAQMICAANISSAQCYREAAKANLEIRRNTSSPRVPVLFPDAAKPSPTERFVKKPGQNSAHAADSTIQYWPGQDLHTGDWVRLNYADGFTEPRCVLPDPATFAYNLAAATKSLIFGMLCPDAMQVQVRDSASGSLQLPVPVTQMSPGNFKADLCDRDFTRSIFTLYVGQAPGGISYPLTPTGTQTSPSGCSPQPPADGGKNGAIQTPVVITQAIPPAAEPVSTSAEGRLLAFAANPARGRGPVALQPAAVPRPPVLMAFAAAQAPAAQVNAPPPAANPPTITKIQPTAGPGGPALQVTLTGTGLSGATVTADSGITVGPMPSISADGKMMTTTFTFAADATPAMAKVTVTTPSGTATSKFGVNPPTVTSIDKATGTAGAALPVTLTGTNFTSDSTISAPGITVTRTTATSATQLTATFTIPADAAAGPVNITVTNAAGVSAAPAKALFTINAAPAPPDSVIQVTEGSTVITGYYTTSTPPQTITAKVLAGDTSSSSVIELVTGTAISGGKFTINLTQPLAVEDTVELYGVSDSTMSVPLPVRVAPSGFDWGRVRAYFTFGIILSSSETATATGQSTSTPNPFNTTSASPFIAFDLDKNWLLNRGGRNGAVSFDSFFNARLTQIGTAALSSATSPTSLLASQQAGSLQGGAYLPINLTRWDYRNHYYSLYAAPLVKGGFYTSIGNTSTAGSTQVNSTSFYKFYGAGMRVGHYREYRYWDGKSREGRAPEQLSYMDFLVGRWGNFESVEQIAAGTPATPATAGMTGNPGCPAAMTSTTTTAATPCMITARPWRLGFEGILQVPNTPFILGVSANIPLIHPRSTLGPGYYFMPPPDDLRFLIGVRFDGKTLLAPLTKLATASGTQ